MIILTAGHTGAGTGAQCITTQFDEGAENIWLRNRVAEILTNKYGLVVLVDDDRASLQLLVKSLTENISLTENNLSPTNDTNIHKYENGKIICDNLCDLWENKEADFVIDLHFNAHTNPQARGTEAIVSDDATTIELRFASRLAHATAEALEIPLRSIKSETQTPHRRLAMLHLTPQSIILEICFCTSPQDVEAYRQHRENLAETLAKNIAELITP